MEAVVRFEPVAAWEAVETQPRAAVAAWAREGPKEAVAPPHKGEMPAPAVLLWATALPMGAAVS